MAFTYADSSEHAGNVSAANVAYTGLGTITAGDLIVGSWAKSNQAATLTGEPADLGTAVTAGTNGNQVLRVYFRVATGSESGNMSWTTSGSCNQAGVALRYAAGAAASLAAQNISTGTGTTATCPSVAATQAGDLILRIVTAQGSATVSTEPGTHREAANSGAAAGCFLRLNEQIAGGSGAVGTADFTLSASVAWLAATVILTEFSGGGGVVVPVFTLTQRRRRRAS
jgi:hypothetical protein